MAETFSQIAARLTPTQRALLTDEGDWTKSGEGFDELCVLGLVKRRDDSDPDDVVFYTLTAAGNEVKARLAKGQSET